MVLYTEAYTGSAREWTPLNILLRHLTCQKVHRNFSVNLLEARVSYQTQCSRLPNIHILAEQPGVLAILARWRSWVQIPSGTLEQSQSQGVQEPGSPEDSRTERLKDRKTYGCRSITWHVELT